MSDPPSKLVRNERLKLRSTALNGIGITSVAAGFITPLVALTFGLGPAPGRGLLVTVAASLAWLGVGFALHALAGVFLGGLEE